MDPIVRVEAIKKNYGKKEAVKGVTLQIPAGELFVLVGPNGAGKTTTLKMIVGMLKPSSGNIYIGEYSMIQESVKAKKLISYVPDIPYVYEKLTPYELLRFVGRLYDLKPAEIESRSKELLQFFQLSEFTNMLIEEFSHGMRQKAILAAALLHHPKVLILDEPMVGLDPISIKSFKIFLRQKADSGMTIIFSTHTLSMAEELADRIAIINRGQIIALGTLQQLKEKYQSQENLENMFMRLVEKEEIKK